MQAKLRIGVLGVGAMGSAVCRTLASRGHSVVGFEQFGVAHNRGSSHGETRLIRQAYFEHPDYVPLLKRAYSLWANLERDSGTKLFHRTGLVIFGTNGQSPILTGVKNSARDHKIPIEVVPTKQFRHRFPHWRPAESDEAVLEPGAGYLEVEKSVAVQVTLAQRDGALIRFHTPVKSWRATTDGVRIEMERETIEVDRLVITSGAWTRELLAQWGVTLSVHRNLLFWYGAPDWFASGPCFAFERGRNFFYGFPKGGPSGVKIGNHVPGRPLESPEQLDTSGWEADEQTIRRFLGETIPELAWKPSKVAACLYELSPDENFILDRHPAHPNVVVGAGFSGHGFKFSPVIGEALADLAVSGTTSLPIDFLKLSRFKK